MRKRLPPLHWLRAFEAAARHQSFTAAASELHVTQSAVSQQVKALEQYLGRALFLRRPRSLRLTDAGRGYLPVVTHAFAALAEGTDALLGHDPARTLEVRCNTAFGLFWLTPRLPAFLARNPTLELTLYTAMWEADYSGGQASVEVRYGREEWAERGAERLASATLLPVATPALAARLKTPDELGDARLLHVAGLREGWPQWLAAAGVREVPDAAGVWCNTFAVSLELARRGAGVAIAHELLVADALAAGDLVAPFDLRVPGSEAYWLLPPRPASGPAGVFCDWLREQATVFGNTGG